MYTKVERTFYGLSAMALMAVLFIATPNNSPEMKQFQNSVALQTKTAIHQIFGGMDPISDIAFLWEGNQKFLTQSSDELLAVIPVFDEIPAPVQSGVDHLAYNATAMLTSAIDLVLGIKQPASYVAAAEAPTGDVLGIQTSDNVMGQPADAEEVIQEPAMQPLPAPQQIGREFNWVGEAPVNSQLHPWVTLQDNVTGELYCVGVYGDEVNKYAGACQYDYH